MKMVNGNATGATLGNEEVVDCWHPDAVDTMCVVLTDSRVHVILEDLPRFHPFTGEALSYPDEEESSTSEANESVSSGEASA